MGGDGVGQTVWSGQRGRGRQVGDSLVRDSMRWTVWEGTYGREQHGADSMGGDSMGETM